MTKRVGLYLRVSTKNGQTVDNQRKALTEAIGRRQGWVIVDEFPDKGISGSKGRDKRPEFDRLLKAVVRRKIDKGILKTARECGTGTSAVQRVKAEMARAENTDP
jgi:DNA invertase Pin-like site-specific DNA recombinase